MIENHCPLETDNRRPKFTSRHKSKELPLSSAEAVEAPDADFRTATPNKSGARKDARQHSKPTLPTGNWYDEQDLLSWTWSPDKSGYQPALTPNQPQPPPNMTSQKVDHHHNDSNEVSMASQRPSPAAREPFLPIPQESYSEAAALLPKVHPDGNVETQFSPRIQSQRPMTPGNSSKPAMATLGTHPEVESSDRPPSPIPPRPRTSHGSWPNASMMYDQRPSSQPEQDPKLPLIHLDGNEESAATDLRVSRWVSDVVPVFRKPDRAQYGQAALASFGARGRAAGIRVKFPET